jgi:hypothetical protein
MTELECFTACVFEPDDIVEIRRIPSKRSTWHKASELTDQFESLVQDNADGQNIFAGPNPRSHRGGTKKSDVILARCLFADIDGITVEEALKRIRAAGLPEPTLLSYSGHGVHAYWSLLEPITDLAEWKAIQKRLIQVLHSDPAIHDPPRVMRLPGFLNVKREPHVFCRIIDADPQRRYPLNVLLSVLPIAEPLCSPTDGQMGDSPGDDFCRRAELKDILLPHGWTFEGEQDGEQRWRRPGADASPGSATFGNCVSKAGRKQFHVFSSNAGLPSGSYNLFSLYTYLNHGGDFKAAAAALVAQGYGNGAQQPFPVEALPDPIGPYARDASEAIGCDVSYVALLLLASLASAIGNARRIRLKPGWIEPSILWAVIVGESGQHKTPAVSAATEALEREQQIALTEYQEQMKDFRAAMEEYNSNIKAWDKLSAEKRQGQQRPVKPEQPIAKRYVVSDTTVEALAILLRQTPRGVLLVRDELAGWLNSFDAYKSGKGGDTAHWLTFYNAKPMTIDRKTGDEKIIHVPHASVSIAGGIQPCTLRRALGHEHFENGLAARLLLAYPPKRPRIWSDAVVSADLRCQVGEVFRQLLALDFRTNEDDKAVPLDLPLSPAAREAFISFVNRHGVEVANLAGNEAALWAKLEGTAARLALVLQLVQNPAATEVDDQSMNAGIKLADWFGAECRRVYRMLSGGEAPTDLSPELTSLMAWVRNRGGIVAIRDLTRGPQRYRNDPVAAEAALSRLVDAGCGGWDDLPAGEKGGRPTRRFRLETVGDGDETRSQPMDFENCVALPAAEQIAAVESTMGMAV